MCLLKNLIRRYPKTVFICHRGKEDKARALAVYNYLKTKGFDVYIDNEDNTSGDIEQILDIIKTKEHFLIILTRDTLARCKDNPKDWVRREIERAIQCKRNIIPLWFGNKYREPEQLFDEYLPPELATPMKRYKWLKVYDEDINTAMEKLTSKGWLRVRSKDVRHPPSAEQLAHEAKQKEELQRSLSNLKSTPQKLEAERLLLEAEQLHQEKKYEQAVKKYTESIELNPTNAYAYFDRGLTYIKLGNFQNAIEDYTKVIELEHDFAQAYYYRGYAYNKLGKHEQAIHDFKKALELGFENDKIYNDLGVAYRNLGRYVDALNCFSYAIVRNPRFKTAYRNRAAVHKLLGKYSEANDDEQRAKQLDHNT